MLSRLVLVGLLALSSSGCVASLYPHRTLEGAVFGFSRLPEVREGMTHDEVRGALGAPLEVSEASGLSMWRYFERAHPRWCDGGSSKAVAPEYSIEAVLVFREGSLVLKKVRQAGTPVFP